MRLLISCLTQLLVLVSPAINGRGVPSTSPTRPQPPAVGKLITVRGTVRISRSNLRNPIVASRNSQLFQRDRILIAGHSSARILCFQGFQQFELQTGEHNVSCSADVSGDSFTDILNRGRSEVASFKGPNGSIIVPKSNDYPAILLRIINSRPASWSTSISLKRLLPDRMRSDLVTEIRSLPMTVDERRLLLADVYSLNKSYDRAIDELSGVSGASNDPLIQISLGDLFLASNLPVEAKRSYSSAIKGAVIAKDSLGEAIAQHALGMVYRYEGGRVSEAAAALAKAVQLYRDLGETGTADQVKQERRRRPTRH